MEIEVKQKEKLTKEILEKQLVSINQQAQALATASQIIKQLIDKFDWNQ